MLRGHHTPVAANGRTASKLSSRRNRRKKRREGGTKESVAVRKGVRLPLPSAGPLANDCHEAGLVRGGSGGGAVGTAGAAGAAGAAELCVLLVAERPTDGGAGAPTPGGGARHRETAGLQNNEPYNLDEAPTSVGERPRAKKQKLTTGGHESVHANIKGPRDEAVQTDKGGVASRDRWFEKGTKHDIEQRDSPRVAATDGSPAGVKQSGDSCAAVDVAGKTCRGPTKKAIGCEKTKLLTPKKDGDIPRRIRRSGRMERYEGRAKEAQSFVRQACPHSDAPEVIDLLDDNSDDDDRNVAAKPSAKKETTTEKGTAKKTATCKKNRTKRGKRKSTAGLSRSESASIFGPSASQARGDEGQRKATERNQSSVTAKDKTDRAKALPRNQLCFACSPWSCHSAPRTFQKLSGSVASQERELVIRLQQVERDIAWKEGHRYDVARRLVRMQKGGDSQDHCTKDDDGMDCPPWDDCFEEVGTPNSRIVGRRQKSKLLCPFLLWRGRPPWQNSYCCFPVMQKHRQL